MIAQLARQRVDQTGAFGCARFHDLHQGRPAERGDAEKSRAKLRARFAFESGRIDAPECERAAHRPFARLGGAREHEGVGRVEPNGAQKLHLRGPPAIGSNQATFASAGSKVCRSTLAFAARLISKSPFSSISRRTPFSGANWAR